MSERSAAVNPLVSILVPLYNGSRFVEETLESVRHQTFVNWELIIVDDGSSDGSAAVVEAWCARATQRVRILTHEGGRNRGVSASRNLALKHATGEFVACLDADDVWLPHKLEAQVRLLIGNGSIAMVFGATQYWYGWTGRPEDLRRDEVPALGIESDRIFGPLELTTRLYPLGTGTAPCPCDLLFRRAALEDVGGFEEDFRGPYQLYEDQALLAKIYAHYSTYLSGETWSRYRIHDTSCMANSARNGDYQRVRRFFLNWLHAYFDIEEIEDASARAALAAARRSLGNDNGSPAWLRVAEGNHARLTWTKDGIARIDIDQLTSPRPFDVQLNFSPLPVVTGAHRAVFGVRADRSRRLFVGLAQAHAPWQSLGAYQQIEVSNDWLEVELTLTTAVTSDNGRLLFDIGEAAGTIEIAGIVLDDPGGRRLLQIAPTASGELLTGDAMPASTDSERRTIEPLSRTWGWDRGLPIDRYYVDDFLRTYAADITGRVLEVGEAMYARRYAASSAALVDVLSPVQTQAATLLGDLSNAPHLESNAFDTIVLTQTLQYIKDLRAAIATVYRLLKPRGVALITLPALTRVQQDDVNGPWWWTFTTASARALCGEAFGAHHACVRTYGNIRAATAFLEGRAAQELTGIELDAYDPDYPVTITLRCEKADRPPAST